MPHSTNFTPLNLKTEELTVRNNYNMQGTNAVESNPLTNAIESNPLTNAAGSNPLTNAAGTNGTTDYGTTDYGTTDGGITPTTSPEITHNYVNLYTIARLSGLRYRDARTVFSVLDHQDMGYVPDVPCIQELNDGSWELIVRRGSITRLNLRLMRIFPGCFLNVHYDPLEPNTDEVERLGYERAKYCTLHSFLSRATSMAKESLPVAGEYYQQLLDKIA